VAYAGLAGLKPEFGLYSSFVGVMLYWAFATSKDITIGPVAVLSTLVGGIVADAAISHPHVPGYVVASALALISGCIVFGLGMLRLGFIVDYIPLPAIAAFMTGSALNIAMGQIPVLMGITTVKTRQATYLVFINFWKHIGDTKLDAALGLTALFMLYLIRYAANFMARKQPKQQKLWFFVSTLRTAFVILLYTMISWLMNRHHRKKPVIAIVSTVPKGFQHMGVPNLSADIIEIFASELPAAVIVLLIEHIAISKSFGRVNNYTIDPSQELIAIGITNIFGPFFGAYPATGSFSRTAIKSKAGVRTPLAGVMTGVVVLLAIYLLTAVFFYIPKAALAAVIIHAVGDLVTPPNTVYRFWRVSPLEVIIFFAGVIVTIFSSIENGIYVTVATSGGLLLFRIAKARGQFLGKVQVHSVIGDHLLNSSESNLGDNKTPAQIDTIGRSSSSEGRSTRNVYLPIDHHDGSNPEISLTSPYPGIFVYRFTEGFLYPNANHYTDQLVSHIMSQTRRTNPDSFPKLGDRPWNDAGPRNARQLAAAEAASSRPTLKAIILDFSSVNNVDITSVQVLIDIRNQLDRYASPDVVEWHFASIGNRWTKRALASAGFGLPAETHGINGRGAWKPVFSVAEIGAGTSKQMQRDSSRVDDAERLQDEEANKPLNTKQVVISSVNRPLFHVDVDSALISAIENAS